MQASLGLHTRKYRAKENKTNGGWFQVLTQGWRQISIRGGVHLCLRFSPKHPNTKTSQPIIYLTVTSLKRLVHLYWTAFYSQPFLRVFLNIRFLNSSWSTCVKELFKSIQLEQISIFQSRIDLLQLKCRYLLLFIFFKDFT